MEGSDALRGLPQVDGVIEAGGSPEPHALKAAAARRVVAEARTAVREGAPAPSLPELAAAAGRLLEQGRRRRVVPVVNATGVLLHTNLGRAPLGRDAMNAVEAISMGYSNLEYDLAEGRRGSPHGHPPEPLAPLTRAKAPPVVNNNAPPP